MAGTDTSTPAPTFTRRDALVLAGGAAAGAMLFAPHVAKAAAPLEIPPLPYGDGALAPTISQRTVGLHYGVHSKGYYAKVNQLAAGKPYADMSLAEIVVAAKKSGDTAMFNQSAQAWNHDLYWATFKGGSQKPDTAFAKAVDGQFGGLDGLVKKMVETGDTVFGTGWVWLVKEGDGLAVVGMKDGMNPLADGKTTLAGVDVWEHAYYLDYEYKRAAHVEAVLRNLVNWQVVSDRFG
ncbi:MAG: superoxide dismutase [Rhizobiales bacterium]|nr:superoxide dismutase [Hyphomicrobiales bacterium]